MKQVRRVRPGTPRFSVRLRRSQALQEANHVDPTRGTRTVDGRRRCLGQAFVLHSHGKIVLPRRAREGKNKSCVFACPHPRRRVRCLFHRTVLVAATSLRAVSVQLCVRAVVSLSLSCASEHLSHDAGHLPVLGGASVHAAVLAHAQVTFLELPIRTLVEAGHHHPVEQVHAVLHLLGGHLQRLLLLLGVHRSTTSTPFFKTCMAACNSNPPRRIYRPWSTREGGVRFCSRGGRFVDGARHARGAARRARGEGAIWTRKTGVRASSKVHRGKEAMSGKNEAVERGASQFRTHAQRLVGTSGKR